MSESISQKDLVRRALAGLDVPRPAVGPLAVHYCSRFAGVSLREYTTNARAMADSVVKYYEKFRPDAVWVSADTWVTAEAMGAAVCSRGEDQPVDGCGRITVKNAHDISRIPFADPFSQGRMPLMLEALSRIKAAIGDEVFIIACFDQYPFSAAAALMGIDQVMLRLFDDQPLIEALMQRGLEYATAYALALAEGGADMLSGGDSPAGLIGPKFYRDVAAPYERKLIEQIHAGCDLPVSLHICGDATSILADMACTSADILEIDYMTDIDKACKIVVPEITLWGNLDPVGLLCQSSAQEVTIKTQELCDAFRRNGRRRFVLSSGCTLAMETPAENLHALIETARKLTP
ncbi:MAG: uroporphyrinogen decarboxylase family protein [Pirellulales bacterium]|nr:uroporphyrinogen decarboxylase family protein [Pirellulales bacterium]